MFASFQIDKQYTKGRGAGQKMSAAEKGRMKEITISNTAFTRRRSTDMAVPSINSSGYGNEPLTQVNSFGMRTLFIEDIFHLPVGLPVSILFLDHGLPARYLAPLIRSYTRTRQDKTLPLVPHGDKQI